MICGGIIWCVWCDVFLVYSVTGTLWWPPAPSICAFGSPLPHELDLLVGSLLSLSRVLDAELFNHACGLNFMLR